MLFRRPTLDKALLMGFVTGAAALNKTNGFFTIYLLPFAAILFDFKDKLWQKKFIRLVGLSLLVVVMTYGFYSILRLSPFFISSNKKTLSFSIPLGSGFIIPL